MGTFEIKWRGQTLGPFTFKSSQTLLDLKERLFETTNVEVGNQKLLSKGKILKDNDLQLDSLALSAGESLLLMGTPSSAIFTAAPAANISGQNDPSASPNKDMIIQKEPTGLINIGNTCYLNATLQSLLSIDGLITTSGPSVVSPVVKGMSSLRDQLSSAADPVIPLSVIAAFHKKFPHMGQRDDQGTLSQQDAEECWTLLINEMANDSPHHRIEKLTGEFKTTMKCSESGESFESNDSFVKLNCHISQDTPDMISGIKAGLQEKITKYSDVLKKDVEFDKSSTIIAFPEYLIVNFIRFFWKAKEQVKAKILKKVAFPLAFDPSIFTATPKDEGSAMQFELISVITHIGRSADSGHYISWSKRNGTWWKFDDDKVLPIHEDEIKKLDGGGDWHTAYLCIYKRK